MTAPHHARCRPDVAASRALPNGTPEGDWPAWFAAYLGPAIAPLLAVGLERGVLEPAGARDAERDRERR
jgi:hypothetical protein